MSNVITKYFVCALFNLPRIHEERDTRKDLLGEINLAFCAIIPEFLSLMTNKFYLPIVGRVDGKVWS